MTSEDTPFMAAPKPRSAWRGGAVIAVIAFAIGLGAMALGYRYLPGRWTAAAPAQPLVAVQPTPAPVVMAAVDPAALAARTDTLAAQIAAMEARVATLDGSTRTAAAYATRSEALMAAFATRRAINRGQSLGYLEGQLRQRFAGADQNAVNTVIQAGREPVTLEDLRLALDTLGPRLVSGTMADGWGNALRREIGGLVVLRQESTPSPRPADRLARARRMLDAGQVEGAIAEIARMPGAGEATSWMTAAKRYIAARQALDTLESWALRTSGPAPAAMPVPPAGQ